MISLEDVIEIRKELFAKSLALVELKGRDYNRFKQEDGDTLFNLRVAAMLDVVKTPERGIMVRLSDKFMRMISLLEGEPSVVDESFEDTVLDIHNYIDYIVAFRRERALTLQGKLEMRLSKEEAEKLKQDFGKIKQDFEKNKTPMDQLRGGGEVLDQ